MEPLHLEMFTGQKKLIANQKIENKKEHKKIQLNITLNTN